MPSPTSPTPDPGPDDQEPVAAPSPPDASIPRQPWPMKWIVLAILIFMLLNAVFLFFMN